MSGKGSEPRPIPDRKKFDSNWDKIFGKPKEKPTDKGTNNGQKA